MSKRRNRSLLIVIAFGLAVSLAILELTATATRANADPPPSDEEGSSQFDPSPDDEGSDESDPPLLEDAGASHQWCPSQCLHWTKPASGPRTLIVLNSTTPSWNAKTETKANQYSNNINKIEINVNNNVSTDAEFRQQCPMPSRYRRIRVCSYQYNNPSWYGLATTSSNPNNGHIYRGRIRLDNSDIGILDDDGLRHVVCMELGHVLGLDHWNTSGNNSCMNEGHWNDAAYDQPANHDYNQVDNQTHHHGGSGSNTDVGDPLNGDRVDCMIDTCTNVSSHSRTLPNGNILTTVYVGPAYMFSEWDHSWPYGEKGLTK